MRYDSTFLIKIDKKTKIAMDKLGLNWSEKVRGFIDREIARKARLEKAEKLRKSLFRKAEGPDSIEVIRKMRVHRHGATGN